jgi:catalase
MWASCFHQNISIYENERQETAHLGERTWKETPSAKEPPLAVTGDVFSYNEREYDNDYYTQPGKLWRLMSPEDRKTGRRHAKTQP